MSKIVVHARTVFILLYTFIFCAAAFGQNADLQARLKNSFNKFKLIRIDKASALQKIKLRQPISIQTIDKNYELNLVPRDLRPARYRAEETTADGVRALERNAVTTFKGTIAGASDSRVRLTIDADKIEGYFATSDEKFFIEPARNYSRAANAADFIVYQEKDLIKSTDFVCESELGKKIERGGQMFGANRFQSAQTFRVLEIATEADFAFVTELGGAVNANNEILSILNLIEGAYEAELGLTFDVVFQHAWSTADPFNDATASSFLNSFKTFWNANYPQSSIPRDAAHLFTARPNFTGRGQSFLGTVCVSPNSAYGFTGRLDAGTIKYVLTAHEIGHNFNANHTDAIQGCGDTIMNALVSNLTPLDFCDFSRTEISNFVQTNGGCLSPRTVNKTPFDFDGDGKADFAVFRPANGFWFIINSANGSFNFSQFGAVTDVIAPADYDGDGKTDLAVYRAGTWFRLKSASNTFDGIAFGNSSDKPLPADYDGDGKADLAVFRPSTGFWYRLLSVNNSFTSVQFGASGDVPLAADFDGDGNADVNVFRPSNGSWFRLNSGNGAFNAVQFGQNGDRPLVGDYDGDGKADVAVFRPSTGSWFVLRSSNNFLSAATFGLSTDIPVPADYDGDGKTDIAVFRPSSGSWFRLNSSNNAFITAQFGASGDVPIPASR